MHLLARSPCLNSQHAPLPACPHPVQKMKDAQEELERCHAYSKHTKASGASGQLNQRAAAEADKAVAEAKVGRPLVCVLC